MGALDAGGRFADEDRLVYALERDQNHMDPFLPFQHVGILMNINMYDSLLHKTPKPQDEPSLATEWRALDDTTWEFKLRKGMKSHSGDLVTHIPFTVLLERMAFFPSMPKKDFEKVAAQTFADQAPSGTGPYKVVQWKGDLYWRLEVWPFCCRCSPSTS